jgi:hypothetical protein
LATTTDVDAAKNNTLEKIVDEIYKNLDPQLKSARKAAVENVAITYKNLGIEEILKHLNSNVSAEVEAARLALQMFAEE